MAVHVPTHPAAPSLSQSSSAASSPPPPYIPRVCIPQPVHRLDRSYYGNIRPEDRTAYDSARKRIRDLLPQILDIKRTWSRQDDGATERLINAAPDAGISERASLVASASECFPERTTRGNVAPITSEATVETTTPASPASPLMTRIDPSRLGTSVAASLASNEPWDAVERFLIALDPTFGPLADRFKVAGITNKARLLAFAGWASYERDEFLAKELRLDAFERKVVSDELVKLAGREQV
ncbi:hypothetical protein C8Q77DRAFT_1205863 [Trametes polyzona]|nr:hypothetical protein C8Q77DRAFT_1205863 [Trametes polyzona]